MPRSTRGHAPIVDDDRQPMRARRAAAVDGSGEGACVGSGASWPTVADGTAVGASGAGRGRASGRRGLRRLCVGRWPAARARAGAAAAGYYQSAANPTISPTRKTTRYPLRSGPFFFRRRAISAGALRTAPADGEDLDADHAGLPMPHPLPLSPLARPRLCAAGSGDRRDERLHRHGVGVHGGDLGVLDLRGARRDASPSAAPCARRSRSRRRAR